MTKKTAKPKMWYILEDPDDCDSELAFRNVSDLEEYLNEMVDPGLTGLTVTVLTVSSEKIAQAETLWSVTGL